jgi:hypothetical protein
MVDPAEGVIVCEVCNQEIRWGRWQLFNVVLEAFPSRSLAEKREGRCACKGKAYIQSRPPPLASGAPRETSRKR